MIMHIYSSTVMTIYLLLHCYCYKFNNVSLITSEMLCKLRNKDLCQNPRQCLPSKRIRLGVEFGAESLTGIFQSDQGSITQDPSGDIDSLVRDVIDFKDRNDCNSTLDEPRNNRDKCHQHNPLDDQSYNSVQSVGVSGNCTNCCAKDQVILQLKKRIEGLEIAICHNACIRQKDRVLLMYACNLLKQKVQINTGLQLVGSLSALWSIIEHKAKNMRYWEGSKHSLKSRSKG